MVDELLLAGGASLVQAGYSQDRAHILSIHDGCAVAETGAGPDILLHHCDATRGDSGSPLLLRTGDRAAVIAIHVGVIGSANAGQGVAVPAAAFAAALRAAAAAP